MYLNPKIKFYLVMMSCLYIDLMNSGSVKKLTDRARTKGEHRRPLKAPENLAFS